MLIISSTIFLVPILLLMAYKCFKIVSFKSSLILFLIVTTALTLNCTSFSACTVSVVFIKSSLIATNGNFAPFLNLITLVFSEGSKIGLTQKVPCLLCRNTLKEAKTNEEKPISSFARAIFCFFLSLFAMEQVGVSSPIFD